MKVFQLHCVADAALESVSPLLGEQQQGQHDMFDGFLGNALNVGTTRTDTTPTTGLARSAVHAQTDICVWERYSGGSSRTCSCACACQSKHGHTIPLTECLISKSSILHPPHRPELCMHECAGRAERPRRAADSSSSCPLLHAATVHVHSGVAGQQQHQSSALVQDDVCQHPYRCSC